MRGRITLQSKCIKHLVLKKMGILFAVGITRSSEVEVSDKEKS